MGSLGVGVVLGFWSALFISALFFILKNILKDKRKAWIAYLSIFIFVGVFYYQFDDARLKSVYVQFEKQTTFLGKIISDPNIKEDLQEITVQDETLKNKHILVRVALYPRYLYGEKLKISGKIREPFPEGYANYLAKERIVGVMSFPEIEVVSKPQDFSLKGFLIDIKHSVSETFSELLPKKEAAFLTGITLGGTSGFSLEFKEAMKKSGTTHLVALSGYNITIIVWVIFGFFSYFLSRRLSFIFTIISIILFVGMAGAEASVVRAAIMGILVLIAREAGRMYSFRNAIVFTGLCMTILNPKILVFDVGFQLSFLAFLGILYLRPALIKLFHIKETDVGFLSWKDNLFTTISAQLGVLPILISSFGEISLSSIISNTIILPIVPVAMGVGAMIALISLGSFYGALILSWVALVLLKFKIMVIEFFALHGLFFQIEISLFSAVVYYGIFIIFIYVMQRKKSISHYA